MRQPLISAMPDSLVAGPATGTYYTLTPTMVRNISRPGSGLISWGTAILAMTVYERDARAAS